MIKEVKNKILVAVLTVGVLFVGIVKVVAAEVNDSAVDVEEIEVMVNGKLEKLVKLRMTEDEKEIYRNSKASYDEEKNKHTSY
jgi:hypothetical protein